MNEIKISGMFEKEPEMKTIDRPTGSTELCVANLTFYARRGQEDKRMWIDVEAVGKKAFELGDIPAGAELTITGALERAAWKNKQTDDWEHRHFIRFISAEVAGVSAPPDNPLPF